MIDNTEKYTDSNYLNNDFRKPTAAQVSILFSIVILFFIAIGYRVQHRELYSGLLITEFILIMLPALLFLLIFKYDLKKVLRLNKASFLNFFLIFGIMIFALPVAGIFNILNLWLVNSIFGKVIVAQPPVAQNPTALLINILIIGGSAGICEEFLFRGVIQRGLERFGAVKSILITALLFAMTHLDFQKLFGTFVLGSLIGFIVYRSNSLYCGMFAHFTNNSIAVIIGYASNKFMNYLENSGMKVSQFQPDISSIFSAFGKMPKAELIMAAFAYGFVFLVFAIILVLLLFTFLKLTKGKAEKIRTAELNVCQTPVPLTPPLSRPLPLLPGAKSLLWLLPGILLIVLIYIIEVCKFKGINTLFTEQIRILLGI